MVPLAPDIISYLCPPTMHSLLSTTVFHRHLNMCLSCCPKIVLQRPFVSMWNTFRPKLDPCNMLVRGRQFSTLQRMVKTEEVRGFVILVILQLMVPAVKLVWKLLLCRLCFHKFPVSVRQNSVSCSIMWLGSNAHHWLVSIVRKSAWSVWQWSLQMISKYREVVRCF